MRAILHNWFNKLGQETEHGCLPFPVLWNTMIGRVWFGTGGGLDDAWEEQLRRAIRYCIDSGEFREDTPIDLMILRLYGLTLGFTKASV